MVAQMKRDIDMHTHANASTSTGQWTVFCVTWTVAINYIEIEMKTNNKQIDWKKGIAEIS